VEMAIGDTEGNRIILPHIIRQKMDGYRAIDAIDYFIIVNNLGASN